MAFIFKEISYWNLESQFIVNVLQEALSIDATTNTNPITSMVYSPSDIESMFSFITYYKGASLIRMLEKVLGSTVFFGALHNYLEAKFVYF